MWIPSYNPHPGECRTTPIHECDELVELRFFEIAIEDSGAGDCGEVEEDELNRDDNLQDEMEW